MCAACQGMRRRRSVSGEESRHGERVERSRVGRLAKLAVIALAGLVGATALWVAEFNPGEWIQAVTPTPRAPQARPHPEAPLTVVEPGPLGTTSSVSPLPVALHLVATRPGRNVHEGYADIGVAVQSPQTYRAGALLANGARIDEIYADYVVLIREGQIARLYVEGNGH